MTGQYTGEQIAAIVLRALPNTLSESLLTRLPGERANHLRALIASLGPVTKEELQEALRQFRDMQRMANRPPPPPAEPVIAKPPVAVTDPTDSGERDVIDLQVKKRKLAPTFRLPETLDFIEALRVIPTDFLFKAIQDEQTTTVAMVMSNVDAGVAGDLMKRFPQERRTEIAMRLAMPGIRNTAMLESLAKAVLQKAQKMADAVPDLTTDERILNLANVLRSLPRNERMEILKNLKERDEALATSVKDNLYRFDDLMRIADRPMQGLLVELEMKILATALQGVEEKVSKKVLNNMSNRAREMLNEEMGMAVGAAQARIDEAQKKVIELIRRFEEEGKVELEG
jgi:flagellar motor switch protein FliG